MASTYLLSTPSYKPLFLKPYLKPLNKSHIAFAYSKHSSPNSNTNKQQPLKEQELELFLKPLKNSNMSFASLRDPSSNSSTKKKEQEQEILEEEVEEDLPWIQEKALDLVEFTGSVTQAIPGPRVAKTRLPWVLAVPLAYIGITFAFAVVKTVRKFSSPRHARKKMKDNYSDRKYKYKKDSPDYPDVLLSLEVNKNAELCKSIDELFEKGQDEVTHSALKEQLQKTGFSMVDLLRKYIRYTLNEKPFGPDLVVNLIQLRKASLLDDAEVSEIINDISRRIVKDKGPVVMDMSGYSEKGSKRKLAVQVLFGKVYYLSELPEFCGRDSSLIVKEIFGVTDEDAEILRRRTLSEAGDVDSLEKLIDDIDSKDSNEDSSNAP